MDLSSATSLSREQFLAHLAVDGERLAEVAETGGLDADVPACPGWTVRNVVSHTGAVYSHRMASMRSNRRPVRGEWEHAPSGGDTVAVVGWYRERLAEILAELRRRDPAEQTWTFFSRDQTVGFWCRRMAQETVVHRVDVEAAHDAVTPAATDLAVDGIDEVVDAFLSNFWTPDADDSGADVVGSVVVRTGPHLWRVAMEPATVDFTRDSGPSDATVSGEPSELLLWLWGRRPDEAVTIVGDPAVVAGLRRRLVVSTQ